MREEGDLHVERSRWKWKTNKSCCYLRVPRGVLVMMEHDCCKIPLASERRLVVVFTVMGQSGQRMNFGGFQ